MQDSQPCKARKIDHAGNSTTTIPLKLTFEILSRLPAISVLGFRSVSKLWCSIIHSKDFVDAFLTRSRTRPRLLFTVEDLDSRFIFSSPEHDKKYGDKSSTVVARHDMTISDLGYNYNNRCAPYGPYYITSPPVNGLVCCTRGSSIAICNPTTRQLMTLPQHLVLTLPGSRSKHMYWRRIENPTGESYTDVEGGVCINGAIYYGVGHTKKIARFDLRSEKMIWTFINHQGKFGGMECDYLYNEMRVWIQEKEELWNNMACAVPCEWGALFREKRPSCPGEIHTGEVMLVSNQLQSSKPLSVFYCDVMRETCRSAQVEGIADYGFRRIHGIGMHDHDVLCFPGYIENIMFF
ncbi:hypothetical protein CARUB_v10024910mg [Capsella rubella]|uniref:F-box domain-containing protein n=1 Tax=Capsella rubella TaxID=81985 RepID=R0HG80_9BRAS|nr:hypothetical protein CARUB_v10024910mg [Capsella rubella]